MSSSSGVSNSARGQGIVCRCGGHGGHDIGRGGVLEDSLPLCPELHFHREITL
jgi:hypothetical protein